ncbi:MAG: hypothetical protein WCX31_08180 [Salinivirgaceae bacterium]|jgi:hypothetical protein
MAITPANYWPLGSTIQKTITNLSTTSYYRHFGLISVNPIDGTMVLLYRKSSSYSSGKGTIYIRKSTNGGAIWGNEIEIIVDATYDLRNLGGGFDNSGNLFVFYISHGMN